MSKEEALKYCYENKDEFIMIRRACGEDGAILFDQLISGLETDIIWPEELSNYGMEF